MSNIKVWQRFQVIKDGSALKLRIQDAQPEQRQEILDFLPKHFIGDETFHKAAGIYKNEEAKAEYGRRWEHILPDCHVVVCCADDDTGSPIVGVSIVSLDTDDRGKEVDLVISNAKTPELKKLLEAVKVAAEWCDGLKELAVDKFYMGRAIAVHKEYRKLGIARHFVNNRRQICRDHKVPATGALMTATGTQLAALSDGWRVLKEISFDELGRMCGVVFEGPPICKYMVAEENV